MCGASDGSKVVVEANIDLKALDAFAFASRKIPEYMHHRLLLCSDCDLLYANPVPSLEAIAGAYDDAAFDSGEEAHLAAATYAQVTQRISVPDKVGALDIGTGDGAFLEELIALGFSNVCGVEPSAAPIAAAREDIRPLISHALFKPEDFPFARFSLITCFQTIEHLYEPLKICADARPLLKSGGVFLIICHNRSSFGNRILGRKSPIFDIEHLQLFDKKSVRRLFVEAGYQDIQVAAISNRYPLRYWMRLFPIPGKLKPRILAFLTKSSIGSIKLSLPVGNMAVFGVKR